MARYDWAPYVPVAERRRQANREMASLRKRGVDIQPIEIQGRKIAQTFWGQAWCDHLERFSDYANRLPRGRTYVRNGSVCHLAIAKGSVRAKVSGSEIYNLHIQIKTLKPKTWKIVKQRCAGQIGSLLELLQGNLSDQVMTVVTDRKDGLFPQPGEISLDCNCPDGAVMCKHVAAVLYGIGARLDENPELLFTLRGVNHEELIDTDAEAAVGAATQGGTSKRLAAGDLSDLFGIEIDADHADESADSTRTKPKKKTVKKAPRGKKKVKKATKKKTKKTTPARGPTNKTAAQTKPAKKKLAKKTSTAKAVARNRPPTTAVKKTPRKKTARKKTATKVTGGKRANKTTAEPPAKKPRNRS